MNNYILENNINTEVVSFEIQVTNREKTLFKRNMPPQAQTIIGLCTVAEIDTTVYSSQGNTLFELEQMGKLFLEIRKGTNQEMIIPLSNLVFSSANTLLVKALIDNSKRFLPVNIPANYFSGDYTSIINPSGIAANRYVELFIMYTT